MKRRVFLLVLILTVLVQPVQASSIQWVDFRVPYTSLQYAMETDILSYETEMHVDWVDALSVAACRTGGKCGLSSVKKAVDDLKSGKSPQELLGSLWKFYGYYQQAYEAVLGGLLGCFAVQAGEKWKPVYGLKAFSPIASGFSYSHYDDFGNSRSYGFSRKHLGNDLMGTLGTPIVAVEGGVIEAIGWNRYGGWRIGIRSFDSRRYYYYAHLQKDQPFAQGLEIGDIVQAGELIGFMGRTGYSDRENTNNIETVHLHFGIQLIFDEHQKECDSEIWIDAYNIVRLLSAHKCSYQKTAEGWQRVYPFVDLDVSNLSLQ